MKHKIASESFIPPPALMMSQCNISTWVITVGAKNIFKIAKYVEDNKRDYISMSYSVGRW